MLTEKLTGLGFDPFFQQQLISDDLSANVPVRILNVQRFGLHIMGEQLDRYVELLHTDFELQLTVGDWALFNKVAGRVVRRLDRKSLFKRRAPGTDSREQLIAANVDTLFIVSSCNMDFNEARLERYLAIAREAQVMAVIVLTKADLVDNQQAFVSRAAGLAPAIQVEALNALQSESMQCLQPWLTSGQTIALLGSSGVGKSTLTNTLLGHHEISTQAVREDDSKGRHTTTSRSMFQLPGGAWLLDTPGMRELQLVDVKSGLDDVFAEISALATECRFKDCGHENEPGCRVLQAITAGEIEQERLDRWRKLAREEAFNSASIAERRARDKAFGRLCKNVMSEKQKSKREG